MRDTSSESNQTDRERTAHSVRASGGAELAEDGAQMKLHRVVADAQAVGNLTVAESLCEQRQHVVFARGERFVRSREVLVVTVVCWKSMRPRQTQDQVGLISPGHDGPASLSSL